MKNKLLLVASVALILLFTIQAAVAQGTNGESPVALARERVEFKNPDAGEQSRARMELVLNRFEEKQGLLSPGLFRVQLSLDEDNRTLIREEMKGYFLGFEVTRASTSVVAEDGSVVEQRRNLWAWMHARGWLGVVVEPPVEGLVDE